MVGVDAFALASRAKVIVAAVEVLVARAINALVAAITDDSRMVAAFLLRTACINGSSRMISIFFSCAGDEVIVSDSEGSFDAAYRLKAVSDVLLIAAGSGKILTRNTSVKTIKNCFNELKT